MIVHGIEFKHRQPRSADSSEEYAQFMCFAALAAHHGVAAAVRNVFFDTKWQGFNIGAVPEIENGVRHQVLQWCAEKSLRQFEIFGRIGMRDRAEPFGSCDEEEAF